MIPCKILLVDDDQWLLESMAQWLSEQHYSVLCAASVEQAQRILQKESPDLALVDVSLEGPDGFALLAWCRKHRPELPVVMMTGYAGADAGACAGAGACPCAEPVGCGCRVGSWHERNAAIGGECADAFDPGDGAHVLLHQFLDSLNGLARIL